jgi:filamentous hemagglutinin
MSTVKRVSGDYTIETINAGDVVNLSSPFVNINGNLTVTGNAVLVGNINADKIFNGTSSVEIPVTNGNITFNPGGAANVMVISPSGTSFSGTVAFAGNVDAGNINTAGGVYTTNAAGAGNISIVNGNMLIAYSSNATSNQNIRFQDSNIAVTSVGSNIGGIEWFTSDATGAGARITARIRAVYEDSDGNANIQIQTGSTSTPTTRITVIGSSGNVGIANAAPLHAFAVTGTVYGSSTLTAVGNITGGNLLTGGSATATGNIVGGNLITAGVATVTGNITGGNVISLGAVSAGSAGITATGNIRGGNINSDDQVSVTGNVNAASFNATQNFSTTGNVRSGTVTASGNIVGANLNVTGNSYGTGIGVENIVWQPTTVAFDSAVQANVGTLGFFVLGGYTYKYEAYLPILPDGGTTTGFSTYFDAGTCYYTVEAQTTQTSAFAASTSNVSGTAAATQAMTGTTPRTARITGTIYSAGNANVTIQAQTSAANINVQSGAYLTYTRLS